MPPPPPAWIDAAGQWQLICLSLCLHSVSTQRRTEVMFLKVKGPFDFEKHHLSLRNIEKHWETSRFPDLVNICTDSAINRAFRYNREKSAGPKRELNSY